MMYKSIKKIYLFLIPRKVHYKLEPLIRSFLYFLFYRGDDFYCPICNSRLKNFIIINFKSGSDNSCPKCGSLSRTRLLLLYLKKEINTPFNEILDFSPHRSLYNLLSKTKENYIANDFENQFHADTHHDITKLPFEENKFDSLDIMTVAMEIEKKLDIKISDHKIKKIKKPKDLLFFFK